MVCCCVRRDSQTQERQNKNLRSRKEDSLPKKDWTHGDVDAEQFEGTGCVGCCTGSFKIDEKELHTGLMLHRMYLSVMAQKSGELCGRGTSRVLALVRNGLHSPHSKWIEKRRVRSRDGASETSFANPSPKARCLVSPSRQVAHCGFTAQKGGQHTF